MQNLEVSTNPFESGERKVIPAVLVYVRRGTQILMIHRNTGSRSSESSGKSPRKVDFHEGKWNGLGGKCELDESPRAAAIREVQEESGLVLKESQLCPLGVIQFPNFKPKKNEDWMVFIWEAELDSRDLSEPKKTSAEGDLHWIEDKDLTSLNLWPGDRYFIPFVLRREPLLGTIWYQDGQVAKWEISSLKI